MDQTTPSSTQEWHRQRSTAIGASEAAAVLGLDPWSSPLEVWAKKTGRIARDEDGEHEHMKWGHLLEPVILKEYSSRRDGEPVKRHPQDTIIRHPDFPNVPMSCTPDAFGVDRLIQIKTTSAWNADAWKDGPPLHVQIQEQHEMAVCGLDVATVVALIGGQRLGFWDIERNPKFITALEEQLATWWKKFVIGDVEPPATDGDSKTIRMVEKLHPDDSGEEVILDDSFVELDENLIEIKRHIRTLEAEKKRIENKLKGAIGAATFGLIPNGGAVYSWKTQNRAGYTVDDTKFRVLRRGKK